MCNSPFSQPPTLADAPPDRLDTDRDYILLKRFDYSLEKLLRRYPDGAPDEVIAQALGIKPEEVEEIYQNLVLKIRAGLQASEPCESILP